MASTIYRLTSLVVIITIVLTGFGLAVRITMESQHSEINLTCVDDGPINLGKRIIMIGIGKQDQGTPIVSVIVNDDLEMRPGNKDRMKAEGYIDNDSSKSYLTLTIENPGIKDDGWYTCKMIVREENHRIKEDIDSTHVTFDNTRTILADLNADVGTLITTVKDLQSMQKEALQTLQEQKQDIDDFISEACREEGWTLYHDQTCLKSFGGLNYLEYLNWTQARIACQGHGGDLVQIFDDDKQRFVFDSFSDPVSLPVWIGIYNDARSGLNMRYVNGSFLNDYQPWPQGWPKGVDENGNSTCVALYLSVHLYWYDPSCSGRLRYMCSKPSKNVF